MSARILVIDDLLVNCRLLQAKLGRLYYQVLIARRGEEGVQVAVRERPDLILLDVMMPGGIDGFEACRRLKAHAATRDIPVVMITALGDRANRVRGLQAGAEEFLSKPIDDVQLMARVKSLLRLKLVADELRAREANAKRVGVIEEERVDPAAQHRLIIGNVLVIDDNLRQIERIKAALNLEHRISVMAGSALGGSGSGDAPDLAIVAVTAKNFDGFRIIARIRAGQLTRDLPILAIIDPDESKLAARALELGAHDIIVRPIDEEELLARTRTLLRHKRSVDALRARLDQGLELAITDQLTGLYNRRFLYTQLNPLAQRAQCGGDNVAVMVIDIDHFKRCNDTYGHQVGDVVLQEFAARVATNVRPADFACRMGGEEFAIIMPNTNGETACLAAERLRRHICASPFRAPGLDEALEVTCSIGVASSELGEDSAESLLKRADEALYEAKRAGRNRVIGKSATQAA